MTVTGAMLNEVQQVILVQPNTFHFVLPIILSRVITAL